jgi:tetratricopeptide (TPR) repeat protein
LALFVIEVVEWSGQADGRGPGAWLRGEVDNWLPALRTAADGHHQLVADVAAATRWYAQPTPRWHGWHEVHQLARAAADALPDLRQRAFHTSLYGWTSAYLLGRYEEAAEVAMQAYLLAEDIGDLREQSNALAGAAWLNLHRYDEALRAHRDGCELADGAGDHHLYVDRIIGIGFVLEYLGRYEESQARSSQRPELANVTLDPICRPAGRDAARPHSVEVGR